MAGGDEIVIHLAARLARVAAQARLRTVLQAVQPRHAVLLVQEADILARSAPASVRGQPAVGLAVAFLASDALGRGALVAGLAVAGQAFGVLPCRPAAQQFADPPRG